MHRLTDHTETEGRTMSTTILTSVIEGPDTGIDSQVAYRQIMATDRWRLARLAARDLFYDETAGYIQFDVKITKNRRVIVKLAANDTYSVEIGRVKTVDYLPTYLVLAQEHDVHCEDLGATVERMCLNQS
jgi:hypothetical protein